MPRKVVALFLLGVLIFVTTAVVATNLSDVEPQVISDPLVRDTGSFSIPQGDLYTWISGYASQSNPGLLYNVYGGAGDSGICQVYTYSFDPFTVSTLHKAWFSAQISTKGWCYDVRIIYAEISWVPG
ncbi:hypothetical protein E3E26_10480 [Thermococcus sp. LS1]|uniref:hypothetical protein n=1 Tax=Thermococcus sp. LS1 TaxID=1638259 RepID=UPI00143975AB|nr:hypothetical protein [Thermococcus sp. LS1]NJE00195.1 hypothetical protein [Thermococcus sp. LS1]